MNDPLAIAAATEALRHILQQEIPKLDPGLSDLKVTTQPLDVARNGVMSAQLNLFLYLVEENSARRNQALSFPKPAGMSDPAMELNLHYLVTAFGRAGSDGDAISHRVLGSAMSTLQSYPILTGAEINLALTNTDSVSQFDRIRIGLLPTSVDEMSKLWTLFQSPYRISAQYQVNIAMRYEGAPENSDLIPPNALPTIPETRLSDLELPTQERATLHQIVDEIISRKSARSERGLRPPMGGVGVDVLFTGDDDTTKGKAAEALANELDLPLYRVDLTGIVSKYIGETEKNLSRLFDEAERTRAILLFDEADALLGNRAEVKDSNDRYANIEIGFILQRIGSYCSPVIFATKSKSELDQAFLRRLRFLVDFSHGGS
jgi:hypothetical protein